MESHIQPSGQSGFILACGSQQQSREAWPGGREKTCLRCREPGSCDVQDADKRERHTYPSIRTDAYDLKDTAWFGRLWCTKHEPFKVWNFKFNGRRVQGVELKWTWGDHGPLPSLLGYFWIQCKERQNRVSRGLAAPQFTHMQQFQISRRDVTAPESIPDHLIICEQKSRTRLMRQQLKPVFAKHGDSKLKGKKYIKVRQGRDKLAYNSARKRQTPRPKKGKGHAHSLYLCNISPWPTSTWTKTAEPH